MAIQSLVIILTVLIALLVIGVPISYAIGISSLAAILQIVPMDVSVLTGAQRTFVGMSKFSLTAIPFFILAGNLMNQGGIAKRLVDFVLALLGKLPGALLVTNVGANALFGAISGSASAAAAAVGSMVREGEDEQGYDKAVCAATNGASAPSGLLIPPSNALITYSLVSGGTSVAALFLAGYIPGALLAISLMIGSYIISVKRNYPKGDKFSMGNLLKQISVSFWALAAVLIVVVGVVGGVFTATESAAIAVIYSLIVSVFIYKGLDWKGVWNVLGDCVDTLSIVLILIATSSVFGFCLTRLHVPELAAQAITGLTTNPILLALLLNLILLFLGCIMDMAPIILIATPILLPIATSIGLDPVQFGIMVVLNCGIGLLTPPVGAVLFIGSAIAKLPMEKVVKATLPFYLCMIITLLLITFIPGISMWLPTVLGT